MRLTLTNVMATLIGFQPRLEHHGNETEPRSTLSYSICVSNAILDIFDHRLRRSLYEKENEAQGDLVDEILTKLRHPFLKPNHPFKTDFKGFGYRNQLCFGFEQKTVLDFELCNISDFKYDPKEGGTVVCTFKVACNPSSSEVAILYELLGTEVVISIIPPEIEAEVVTAQPDLLDQENGTQEADYAISDEAMLSQAATSLSQPIRAEDVFATPEELEAERAEEERLTRLARGDGDDAEEDD